MSPDEVVWLCLHMHVLTWFARTAKVLMGWSHPHPSLLILSPEDQHLMTHTWPFLLPPVRKYGFGSKKDSIHALPLSFTTLA